MSWSMVYMSLKRKNNPYPGQLLSTHPMKYRNDYQPIHNSNGFMLAVPVEYHIIDKILTYCDENITDKELRGKPRFWFNMKSLPERLLTPLRARNERCKDRDGEIEEQPIAFIIEEDELNSLTLYDFYNNRELIGVTDAWNAIKDL